MVEKFCARSHGQPVPAARSAAIISMRRAISREGVTFDMSDDPRCPGTRRCYQGGTPPCKLFAAVHAPLPRLRREGAEPRVTRCATRYFLDNRTKQEHKLDQR